MMHELFLNVAYVCGIVICVVATVIAVKFSFCYVVKRKESFVPDNPKVEERTRAEHVLEILKHVKTGPPELRKKPIRVSLPEPAPAPEQEPEPEIECGNCGKVINSEPVGGEARDGNVFVQIYECANCGAKVEV